MDSPAIKELLSSDMENVFLVPPGNPHKLADTIRGLLTTAEWKKVSYSPEVLIRIQPKTIGKEFLDFLNQVIQE